MSRILFLLLAGLPQLFSANLQIVYAQAAQSNCTIEQEPPTLIQNVPPLSDTVPPDQRWFKFRITVTDKTATYKVVFDPGGSFGAGSVERDNLVPDSTTGLLRQSGNADLPGLQYQRGSNLFTPTIHNFYVERKGTSGHYCNGSYTIARDNSGGILRCELNFTPSSPDETQDITVNGTILPQANYGFLIAGRSLQKITVDANGTVTPVIISRFNPGDYELTVQKEQVIVTPIGGPVLDYLDTNCKFSLHIVPAGGGASPGPSGGGGSITPIGSPGPGGTGTTPVATPCTDPKFCTAAGGESCGDTGNPGFKTAIGCIHTSPVEFTKDALKFLIGIGGGFAFLMMLLGAFQMLTSAGNPETLQAGRERLTSAIIGLLFVIFAVLLMQIIGFDILKLPDFNR